jgi:two-component system, response regulator PdtaR
LAKILRVLIVEDEAVIGLLLEETVESLGHDVCAIANTEALAVTEAKRCQPDLMIVDAGLRVGNGVSAMDTIGKTQNIPHIFVTGNSRNVRALRPDAIILEKPFFTPDLVDAIERALAVGAGQVGAAQ